MPLPRALPVAALVGTLLIAGCGGSSSQAGKAAQGGGPLSAEATSAATGDIPDSQNFLLYTNTAAGYSLRYPEGWSQRGGGADATLQSKNNIVHITVRSGSPPTIATVAAELRRLGQADPTFKAGAPTATKLQAGPAVKASYTTQSNPNPVTGKRVTLNVDRYEFARNSKLAVVELGTPQGVDNVDAYRMMIQSFRWR